MERKHLNLLRKHLNGETTPEETEFIRNLLIEQLTDEDAQVDQLMFEEWEQTTNENRSGIDIENAWAALRKRRHRQENPEKTVRFNRARPILIAASIIAILGLTAIFYLFSQHGHNQQVASGDEITYTIKGTSLGEKLNISFPDGSFIRLNSSTTLKIPSNYTSDRRVYLDGEAFFEVEKHNNQPFKVITGVITTEVLGTSFNVNANSGNDIVSVAVTKGKVRVSNPTNSIELEPNEMTTVSPVSKSFKKNIFNEESITGWRNNILVFDKVTFDEMIERLRQWYGVEFIVEDGKSPKGIYSGRFENKSLVLVLDGLGFSSSFDYRIIDKRVYLKFK